jgi:hypothetical protein
MLAMNYKYFNDKRGFLLANLGIMAPSKRRALGNWGGGESQVSEEEELE